MSHVLTGSIHLPRPRDIQIGAPGSPQIVINATTFGQANDFASIFYDWPIDGVFGLAYQALAVGNVIPPLIDAIQQGLLDNPIFTVWLGTNGNQVVNQTGGGLITFGGLDQVNCGPVLGWTPLLQAMWYQFGVDSISVGSAYTYSNRSVVISDTGTSLLYGPKAVVAGIAAAVGAVFDQTYGAYFVNCNATYTPVTFSVSGQTYNLTSRVLNLDIGMGNGRCEFAMMELGADFGIDWILGDPFIRQYCTIYDVAGSRLGFSAALGVTASAPTTTTAPTATASPTANGTSNNVAAQLTS